MEFCKAFNAQTQSEGGTIIPVEITVFEDRSFTFITKTPPAAVLIKEAIGLDKGSGEPHINKVGTISMDQVRQIAERKMPDLNANDSTPPRRSSPAPPARWAWTWKARSNDGSAASATASSTRRSIATAPTRPPRRWR